jgi:excisionase family DNA binding protein
METNNQNLITEKVLSTKEVASILQISERTMLRWVNSKKIDGFFRIGRKWQIRKSDFDSFINKKVNEQNN